MEWDLPPRVQYLNELTGEYQFGQKVWHKYADVAELADAIDSEFIGGNSVQVQLLLSAPNF